MLYWEGYHYNDIISGTKKGCFYSLAIICIYAVRYVLSFMAIMRFKLRG